MSNIVLDFASFHEKQESRIPKGNPPRGVNWNMFVVSIVLHSVLPERRLTCPRFPIPLSDHAAWTTMPLSFLRFSSQWAFSSEFNVYFVCERDNDKLPE